MLGGGKDIFTSIFSVAEELLFNRDSQQFFKPGLKGVDQLKKVKLLADTLGLQQTQQLNDCIFENYSSCARYIDDCLENTANYLDWASSVDVVQTKSYKT